MRNKAITALFCLLLLTALAAGILVPDRYYSASEKRLLEQFPTLSWAGVRSGKFADSVEAYLADQFPGRDGWVAAKTVAERLSGKKESGGVYFADDGYLIEIHRAFDARQTAANVRAVKALQDALAEQDVTVRVMPVPTALDVLADKLPRFAPRADQQSILTYAKEQGLHVVDVTETLRAHAEEYIYYRTDHHWTSLGAYYAYAAWMEAKGESPEPLSAWTKEQLCGDFRGTTYAKVNYPGAPYDVIDAYWKAQEHRVDYNGGNYVTDSIYERKYLDGADQYAVFFNSNQATAVAYGGGQGRLLIVKNSYANCFAQFAVDDYQETHLIDMRFFRGSVRAYAEEHGITEVLVLYDIPNFAGDTDLARCGQ